MRRWSSCTITPGEGARGLGGLLARIRGSASTVCGTQKSALSDSKPYEAVERPFRHPCEVSTFLFPDSAGTQYAFQFPLGRGGPRQAPNL